MSRDKRLGVANNPYQGKYKKVLCVCSVGVLRSPTAAWVLSNPPFNFNTRAAGINEEFALIVVDEVLLEWADEVVCMDMLQMHQIADMGFERQIVVLDIPDDYNYRDPILVDMISARYKESLESFPGSKTPLPVL